MPYTSVLGGIFATKMVYDLTQLISTFYFRTYAGLTKIQRIEWNNRGMSSVHAIFIATMSLYFVFWSDLYSDQYTDGPVTFRSSPLSTFALGVVHHTLSAIAVAYAMSTGEGQLYTFMVLISELTTPEINLRWYLDTAGLKKSNAYLLNGVVIFFAWMEIRLQRPPTSGEVYEETHRKKIVTEDGTVTRGEFITEVHGRIFASFTRAFEEKYQDLDTRPVDDPSLWEVVMPRKKGRIFGFGTSHNPMFAMTGTPSTLNNCQSYHFAPTPEVTQLQEALQAERATTENIVNQLLAQLRPNSDGPPLP